MAMSSNRRIVLGVALGAVLVALAAGLAYFLTGSSFAFRLLWIAGPIASIMAFFVLLQMLLPPDGK
jgi:hypothetical protein